MRKEELKQLLDSMTVAEKIGQLVQVPPDVLSADGQELGVREELGLSEEIIRNAGSTLNVVGAEQIRRIQENHLKHSRIPLLFMADIIYGFRTVYPIPLALGCSFEPQLLERLCEATAQESVAAGAHLTFSPMADLVRDARWGRCLESTGEDPYMNGLYTQAMVRGFQAGMDEGCARKEAKEEGTMKGPRGIASCVKHFAAYGAAEGGRDYNTVDMSERRLRQDYLPSYKAGVDAGCAMIMTSFNIVDGIPSTANAWLMRDVLRKEWGFEGVVITDYAAIAELIAHGAAADKKEAARLAMEAGVDIDMCTDCYANYLEELLEEGSVSMQQLDQAVMRVLSLKNRLGLFEDPFRGADVRMEEQIFGKTEFRQLAQEAAVKSMVLLENREGLLPLCPGAVSGDRKLALVGPFADEHDALGMWAIHGDQSRVVTMKQALMEELGEEFLLCAQGCETMLPDDFTELDSVLQAAGKQRWSKERRAEEMEKAVSAAAAADITVAALGEAVVQGGEAGSRTRLTVPGDQMELLRRVSAAAHANGKKVVVVLYAGRPLVLDEVSRLADALLLVWFPGTEGGHAVRDVLFGRQEPGGRLAMSLPRSVAQMPLYYNSFSTGRPYDGKSHERFLSRYNDCPNTPLYPYGYGLGYHSAQYGPTEVSANRLERGGSLTVSASVTNTGDRAGVETVQLYIRDVAGSVVRPVKELKGVKKVELAPGETRQVSFTVTEEMLRFYGKDMEFRAEPGCFRAVVAADSSAEPIAEFVLE